MVRLFIFLISIFLISFGNGQKLLKNGFTQKVSKVTEYLVKAQRDSLPTIISDTLTITEKRYNNNDQLISSEMRYIYSNQNMLIKYLYNENLKIKREIVNLSIDSSSFMIDYFYKDTLLLKSQSESVKDNTKYKQIVKYDYNSDNRLKQSSLIRHFIDIESNDTTTNILEVSKYNKNKDLSEIRLSNFVKPEKNLASKYKYKNGKLISIRDFNNKDSLVSITEFKYQFDEFDNWIKRESIINGQLMFIKLRKIVYK